jgi:ParB family chromosome partitioning protein
MKFLNSGNIVRLPLDAIVVGPRLRLVRDVQVQNLLVMAEDTGITTPIHVRKVDTRHELIDGAHRLEAARRLGMEEIACLLVECRQDEARAFEASNNLGAARMTPLQTAVFAASWKKTYYELHPERRPGVFKGNQHTESWLVHSNALTNSIADSLGRKSRQIFKSIAVGERLSAEEVTQLQNLEWPVTLEELEAIGKISDPEERQCVVRKLSLGAAKKVAQARRQIAEEQGGQPPVKDAESADDARVEAAFKALSTAWNRSPKAARRRFVEGIRAEIDGLLDGSDGE